MAKILKVHLQSIPDVIIVNDNDIDFTVIAEVEFHNLDIDINMEYCLHLFVYDIHGEIDYPLVLPNWDESILLPISLDRVDEYLGKASKILTATSKIEIIKIPMSLKLGKLTKRSSHFSKKLEVFQL